ncbi:MAG TPA: hypothetical protein VGB83_04090 [Actinomycetota bacterium]
MSRAVHVCLRSWIRSAGDWSDFVIVSLFGDREGRRIVAQLDADVDRLPGLGGLRLFERVAEQAAGERGLHRGLGPNGRSHRSPRRVCGWALACHRRPDRSGAGRARRRVEG